SAAAGVVPCRSAVVLSGFRDSVTFFCLPGRRRNRFLRREQGWGSNGRGKRRGKDEAFVHENPPFDGRTSGAGMACLSRPRIFTFTRFERSVRKVTPAGCKHAAPIESTRSLTPLRYSLILHHMTTKPITVPGVF